MDKNDMGNRSIEMLKIIGKNVVAEAFSGIIDGIIPGTENEEEAEEFLREAIGYIIACYVEEGYLSLLEAIEVSKEAGRILWVPGSVIAERRDKKNNEELMARIKEIKDLNKRISEGMTVIITG